MPAPLSRELILLDKKLYRKQKSHTGSIQLNKLIYYKIKQIRFGPLFRPSIFSRG